MTYLIKSLKIQKETKNTSKEVKINISMIQNINNFFESKIKEPSEIEIFVLNKLKETKIRESISCRRHAEVYFKEKIKSISKTYINYIIRNKLNFQLLKTNIKKNKLLKIMPLL